jgi:thymidylate kinase
MTGADWLVRAGTERYLRSNGIPDADDALARRRAHGLATQVLADWLNGADLTCSPLGVDWTGQFEVALDNRPSDAVMISSGWLSLDALLTRAGVPGSGRWAIREGDSVLAAVRFGSPTTDPVSRVLERAQARGEVRLLDVRELIALAEAGADFPPSNPVLEVAADIATAVGDRTLVRWASGRRRAAPVPLSRRGRRARVVVAATGVDGAGKSTLLDRLARDLDRAGVPTTRVWLRPGMGLGRLTSFAALAKSVLHQDPRPGLVAMAAAPERALRSRQGTVGWLWSLLVVASFAWNVRAQHARSRGVVLYDRHLVDALATLEFAYRGADLRLQRFLLRRSVPAADVTFYLDVPLEVAVNRKPGDPIGAAAVRRQLEVYAEHAARTSGAHRLDATRPAQQLSGVAFEVVVRNLGRSGQDVTS